MPIDPSTAFVSYSREDSDFVRRLATDLKAKGAKVWMDKLDIRPGQRWEIEVEKALNGCSRMLAILSPTSVASKNMLAEVAFAIDAGKEVIPVLYHECNIPFRLRPFQYSDFRADYAAGLEELLASLGVGQPSASSVEAHVLKAFGLPATPAPALEEARAAPPASPTVVLDAESRAAVEAQVEQTARESRERDVAAQRARLEQEELERQRVAAEQARLEEERRQAAAEQPRAEQEERERQAAAEKKARLEELERQRIAEQARLGEERKQAAAENARLEQQERGRPEHERSRLPFLSKLSTSLFRSPARKIILAVCGVLVVAFVLYKANWPRQQEAGTKNQGVKTETSTLPPSVGTSTREAQSNMVRSFQNFEPNNGTPGANSPRDYCRNIWSAPCIFELAKVHTGTRSIRVETQRHPQPDQAGGTVHIFSSSREPLNLSGANSISVWVYDTQGSNTVELKLCNGDTCPDRVWSEMKSTRDQWVEITWPLSYFTGVDIHSITGIELYEWNVGVYYFDDINWSWIPEAGNPQATPTVVIADDVRDETGVVVDRTQAPFKIRVTGTARNARAAWVYLVVDDDNGQSIEPRGSVGHGVDGQFSGYCYLGIRHDPGSLNKVYRVFAVVTDRAYKEFDLLEQTSVLATSRRKSEGVTVADSVAAW